MLPCEFCRFSFNRRRVGRRLLPALFERRFFAATVRFIKFRAVAFTPLVEFMRRQARRSRLRSPFQPPSYSHCHRNSFSVIGGMPSVAAEPAMLSTISPPAA